MCYLLSPTVNSGNAPADGWETLEWPEAGKTFHVIPDDVVRDLGFLPVTIPAKQNAAMLYLQVAREVEKLPDKPNQNQNQPDPFKASPLDKSTGLSFNEAQKKPWAPQSNPKLKKWMDKTNDIQRLLKKTSTKKRCDFPFVITGDERSKVMLTDRVLPWLGPLREAAAIQLVCGRALEHEKEYERALHKYYFIIRIGTHLGNQSHPTSVEMLVSRSVQEMGINAIHSCLQSSKVPEKILQNVADKLQTPSAILPDRCAWIKGEKAMSEQFFDLPLNAQIAFPKQKSDINPVLKALLDSRIMRVVWPDKTLKRDVESFFRTYKTACRKRPWEVGDLYSDSPAFTDKHIHEWNVLAKMLTPALGKIMGSLTRTQAELQMLRIEIALRRFHHAHNKFPEKLSALLPTYLKKLPVDPFSGKNFHYEKQGQENWVLYSVGTDQRDDQGREGSKSPFYGNDIVYHSTKKEDTR
jgi:hypothetical protein